jgi:hypothetical protein
VLGKTTGAGAGDEGGIGPAIGTGWANIGVARRPRQTLLDSANRARVALKSNFSIK